jgi:hypothetical protein
VSVRPWQQLDLFAPPSPDLLTVLVTLRALVGMWWGGRLVFPEVRP